MKKMKYSLLNIYKQLILQKITTLLFIVASGLYTNLNAQTYDFYQNMEQVMDYRESVINDLQVNATKTIDVKRYSQLNPDEFAYLRIEEEELLLLITEQFNVLLNDILKRNTILHQSSSLRVIDKKDKKAKDAYKYTKQYYDPLSAILKTYLKDNELWIKENIELSNLTNNDKEFLKLFVDYYMVISDRCNIELEKKIIENSRDYLTKYPESRYRNFIEKYFDIEFKEGNWGLGMYFNIGSIIYSDDLNHYFSNPVLIYVSWDLNYKKLELNMGIGGSLYSKLKNEFYYDTLWQKDHKYSFSPTMHATLGYSIFQNKNINITPFCGIRYLCTSGRAGNDTLYYKNISFDSQNLLTFGINFDYKFAHRTCKNRDSNKRGSFKEKMFADLRLSIGYQNPKFNKIVPDLKGGVWVVTLGFGLNSFPPSRIRKKNE